MSALPVIVRTADQEQDFAMAIALKSFEVFNQKLGQNIKDNEKRLLENLIAERFPDYTTKYRLNKIRKAVDDGKVGGFDRDNNRVASYNELKKYLFN